MLQPPIVLRDRFLADGNGVVVATERLVGAGSIPELYDTYLVPLIFASYAADLARRVVARSPRRVLEIAACTCVVTRAMAALPPGVDTIRRDGTFRPSLRGRASAG